MDGIESNRTAIDEVQSNPILLMCEVHFPKLAWG